MHRKGTLVESVAHVGQGVTGRVRVMLYWQVELSTRGEAVEELLPGAGISSSAKCFSDLSHD
jgi:hypothetical protein